MISNNIFCNDKDVINQLTEEQLKLAKMREWNSVNWYKLYNVDNRCESYVITQRIICFIAFFDFAKRILDSKKYEVNEPNYNKVKTELINDEGCNLKGHFLVDAVPGSFLITSGYYGTAVQRLANDRVLKMNGQHKINEISFGETSQRYQIKKKFWSNPQKT